MCAAEWPTDQIYSPVANELSGRKRGNARRTPINDNVPLERQRREEMERERKGQGPGRGSWGEGGVAVKMP